MLRCPSFLQGPGSPQPAPCRQRTEQAGGWPPLFFFFQRSIGSGRSGPRANEAIQRLGPQTPKKVNAVMPARALPNRPVLTVADESNVDLIVMGFARSGSTGSRCLVEQLQPIRVSSSPPGPMLLVRRTTSTSEARQIKSPGSAD